MKDGFYIIEKDNLRPSLVVKIPYLFLLQHSFPKFRKMEVRFNNFKTDKIEIVFN